MVVEKLIKLNFYQIMFQNICAVYAQICTVVPLKNKTFFNNPSVVVFLNVQR